jgi:preprotein translocase subunit SecE
VSDTVDAGAPDRPEKGKKSGDQPGLGARLALFYRQVVAELRKVVWPTRKELLTYTWVVIVFVAVIATIVAILDLGFAKLVLKVFGA